MGYGGCVKGIKACRGRDVSLDGGRDGEEGGGRCKEAQAGGAEALEVEVDTQEDYQREQQKQKIEKASGMDIFEFSQALWSLLWSKMARRTALRARISPSA